MPSVEKPIVTELPADKTVVEDEAEETTPAADVPSKFPLPSLLRATCDVSSHA